MNLKLFLIGFLLLAALGLSGYAIYNSYSVPSIVYVRSADLIERYRGTVEARNEFEQKKSSLLANVDSLKANYERVRVDYLSNASRLTQAQRVNQEKQLGMQYGQLMQYEEVIDEKIHEEDQKMMQEVLNQINSFVEDYAVKKGYDVVLGTTLSGNLLYGSHGLDITDALLEELNQRYIGR